MSTNMASTNQQTHSSYPPRPYPTNLNHHLKQTSANLGRDHNRIERERVPQGQAGSSNPMNNLTDEQRDEIIEAFSLFDLDKDQRIDYHEFKVALKALGFDLPKPTILSLLTNHGTTLNQPSGHIKNTTSVHPVRMFITLSAFQSIAAKLISERNPTDEIIRAFSLFDVDNKGLISLDDLRRVAHELGEGLEEEEMVAMIEEFDLEDRGGVTKEEFVNICMG